MDLKDLNLMRFIIVMKNSLFSDNKTFIIAEIGNNHEGSYTLAKKMIVEAWKTGVDAIKLQHIVPEKFFLIKNKLKNIKNFNSKILKFET